MHSVLGVAFKIFIVFIGGKNERKMDTHHQANYRAI